MKPPEAFDMGPTGKRRRGVCRDCLIQAEAEKRERADRIRVTFEQDGRLVRLCRRCGEVKPLDAEHFYPWRKNARTEPERWQYVCKPCAREVAKPFRQYVPIAELSPEDREVQRQKWRETALRHIARYPDATRERSRRYQRKVAADPRLRRRRNENNRMYYRFRKQMKGEEIKRRGTQVVELEQSSRLPALPVAEFVEKLIARESAVLFPSQGRVQVDAREVVCERLGINMRSLFGWKSGERKTVQFDIVDEILIASGVLWFDIYDPEKWPDEHREAEQLFDPPEVSARAAS